MISSELNILNIPTENPRDALEFCKNLKNRLENFPSKVPGTCALSVVIPVYNEEENLPVLYDRLTMVLSQWDPDYEIIFVDDGSTDNSILFLSDLVIKDLKVTLIELSRNFGHQIAISAGLDFTRGDAVIVMDADLQDPPEVLPKLIDKWREGYQVVYAVRMGRKENWFMRTAYNIFYRSLKRIANIDIPLDAGDFCIMDRKVVNELRMMPERNRFVRGIRSWVGLNQIGLPYERESRYAGKSKYSLTRLIYLGLDGLVSFSYIPLRFITLLGMAVSFLSISMAIFYSIKKIFFSLSPPGFATMVVSIFFFSGIQLITIGVIGEYVGRIFEEVKQRPLYIIQRVLGHRE